MAARKETLSNPSLPPSKKGKTNRNVNLILSAALLAGASAGLGLVIINTENTPAKPSVTDILEDFQTPPVLSEQEKKAINQVPLAQITKEQGIMFMVPDAEVSQEFPRGYSLSFQSGTIVDIKRDKTNNITWVALALSGDKLTKEDTKDIAKDYDGKQTKLFSYKGFTAWFKIDRSVVSVLNGAKWGGGIEQLNSNLKVGEPANFYVVLDQYDYNKQYELMDMNSLNLLNKEVGKPNLDRSDTSIKFTGDRVFYNTK